MDFGSGSILCLDQTESTEERVQSLWIFLFSCTANPPTKQRESVSNKKVQNVESSDFIYSKDPPHFLGPYQCSAVIELLL